MIRKLHPRSRGSASDQPRDAGVALVMTLGIMLVGIIIIAVVAIVAVANANNTVRNRAEMRAFASADDVLDQAISILSTQAHSTMGDACENYVKPLDGTTIVANGQSIVEITQEYTVRDPSGATSTLSVDTCPAGDDTTVRVKLRATATTPGGLDGDGPVVRTAVAELIPIPPSVGLDKAIFSNASVTLVSNTELSGSESGVNDAHVYSNGGVNCSANLSAGGTVYAAQGDVIIQSGCDVQNSVWASGTISVKSGSVSGNVYAANTLGASPAVSFSGSGSTVTGSVLTNGDVVLDSTSGVIGGSIFTSTGALTATKTSIGGDVYTHDSIDLNTTIIDGDAIAGIQTPGGVDSTEAEGYIDAASNKSNVLGNATALGDITDLKTTGTGRFPFTPTSEAPTDAAALMAADVGYPEMVEAPEPEDLPKIMMDDAGLDLWEAQGWTVEEYSGKCTADVVDPIINSGGIDVGVGRVLVFGGCGSSPVQILSANVVMNTNIALVSYTGFTNQNASTITTTLTESPTFYMISPAQDGLNWSVSTDQPACPADSELYDIRVGAFKMTNVKVFAYTPCDFDYKTSVNSASDPWVGQIYAGAAFPGSGAFKLKMSKTDVPSAVDDPTDLSLPANLTVVARYDEH